MIFCVHATDLSEFVQTFQKKELHVRNLRQQKDWKTNLTQAMLTYTGVVNFSVVIWILPFDIIKGMLSSFL